MAAGGRDRIVAVAKSLLGIECRLAAGIPTPWDGSLALPASVFDAPSGLGHKQDYRAFVPGAPP